MRRSIRTPCGKLASSIRCTRSAASSQRAGVASANATAIAEPARVSCPPTSATDAPIRWRRWALTRLSSARLALSEPASGKCMWTRMSTTNAGSPDNRLGELALDLARLVCLDDVAFLDVRVVREHDAALEAGEDLADVVVDAPQRADLARVDDRAVADQADLRSAGD